MCPYKGVMINADFSLNEEEYNNVINKVIGIKKSLRAKYGRDIFETSGPNFIYKYKKETEKIKKLDEKTIFLSNCLINNEIFIDLLKNNNITIIEIKEMLDLLNSKTISYRLYGKSYPNLFYNFDIYTIELLKEIKEIIYKYYNLRLSDSFILNKLREISIYQSDLLNTKILTS